MRRHSGGPKEMDVAPKAIETHRSQLLGWIPVDHAPLKMTVRRQTEFSPSLDAAQRHKTLLRTQTQVHTKHIHRHKTVRERQIKDTSQTRRFTRQGRVTYALFQKLKLENWTIPKARMALGLGQEGRMHFHDEPLVLKGGSTRKSRK